MVDEDLMRHFEFDESDLQANRNGNFSEEQKRRLQVMQARSTRGCLTMAGVTFVVAVLLFGGAIWLLVTDPGGNLRNAANLGMIAVIVLLVCIYLFRSAMRKEEYLLKKVQGPISIKKERDENDGRVSYDYELNVGDKSFVLDSEVSGIVEKGGSYAVYYWEGSKSKIDQILSIEKVSKGKG